METEIDVTITEIGDDIRLSMRRYFVKDPLTDIDTFHANKFDATTIFDTLIKYPFFEQRALDILIQRGLARHNHQL